MGNLIILSCWCTLNLKLVGQPVSTRVTLLENSHSQLSLTATPTPVSLVPPVPTSNQTRNKLPVKKSEQNWTGCTRHKLDIWNLAGLLEDEITGKLLNGKSRNLDYSNWLLKSPKHQPPYLPRLNQRLKIKFRLRQASVFTMDIMELFCGQA